MPELSDLTIYVERLRELLMGRVLLGVRLASPFLLRSVDPPLDAAGDQVVDRVFLVGKRIVAALRGGPYLMVHLMVAGRLSWHA